MTIAEKLTEDMKTSMKAGDAERTGVLRLLRGALKNEEIKIGHPLDEDETLKVLAREAKQRRDSIDSYNAANRADLAAVEEAELAIIAEYLPTALSDEELNKVVDEVIAEVGATDMKQMGAVIGGVIKRVGTRADGGAVSKLVREAIGMTSAPAPQTTGPDDHATRVHPGTHPSFSKSVAHALHGVIHIFEHERNARAHLLFAMMAFLLGLWLHVSPEKLSAIFFAIIIVFLAEIFNTAIERTLDLIDPTENPTIKLVKDMAAGAVLIAALAAVAIGVVVYGPAIVGLIWGH